MGKVKLVSRFFRGFGRVVVRVLVWGLALVGFLVVLSVVGCSVMVDRHQAQEEARRAACTWIDPLIVSISGQELAIPATGRSNVTGVGGTDLPSETIDEWNVTPRRYAFCLEGPQRAPLEVQNFNVNFDALEALLEPYGVAPDHIISFKIWSGGTMSRRWPDPSGDPQTLTQYRTDNEGDQLYLAAGGVGPDGFRIGGKCGLTHDDRRSCQLWIEDAEMGLSYDFMSLWIEDRAFDGAPVPQEVHDTALQLRALVQDLAADAVGRPGGPE